MSDNFSPINFEQLQARLSESRDQAEVIGKGKSALVYKVSWTDSTNDRVISVAIKAFINKSENEKLFTDELEKLSQLNHPNVIKFYGPTVFNRKQRHLLALVMEVADGSFDKIIHDANRIYSVGDALNWWSQIAYGVEYLHANRLLHRDIKPKNCLYFNGPNGSFIIKISDFGLSRGVNHTTMMSGGLRGTSFYMPPEIIQDKKCGLRADIYSLGITYWETIARIEPYDHLTKSVNTRQIQVIFNVVWCDWRPEPKQPANCPDQVQQLIEWCWQTEQSERPRIGVVVGEVNRLINVLPEEVKAIELRVNNDNKEDIYSMIYSDIYSNLTTNSKSCA